MIAPTELTRTTVPRADEAEHNVLSIAITWPVTVYDAREWQLSHEDFFDSELAKLWQYLCTLFDEGIPIDEWDILKTELPRRFGFWPSVSTLQRIAGGSGSRGYMSYYAKEVKIAHIRRQLLTKMVEASNQLPVVHDPDALWSQIDQEAKSILSEIQFEATGWADAVDSQLCSDDGVEIPTGFNSYDRSVGHMLPGQFKVIGAATGVGKSMVGLSLALAAARSGHGVLYVNLEMRPEEVAERSIASTTRLRASNIRNGLLNEDQKQRVEDARRKLRSLPIRLLSRQKVSVDQIASEVVRAKKQKFGLSTVIVDYIGLVQPRDDRAKRHEQLAEISRTLKGLAMKQDCVVVALSQINREGSTNAKPKLHHLAESSSLERDADIVWLLSTNENDDAEDIAVDVIVAKHRLAGRSAFKIRFDRPKCRMYEPERDEF